MIPSTLAKGFVAVEDRRFFRHGGYELRSIVRAALACVRARRYAQGGSTITQQLARILYRLPHEKTLARKFKEISMARYLEKKYDKWEILEMYLSSIYLGNNQYGVRAASLYYFDKTPQELTLDEQAVLIGLAKSPRRYDPRNHVACEIRKGTVLAIMKREGVI